MKNRKPDPSLEATPITVTAMLGWMNPPNWLDRKTRNVDAPIDEREGDYYMLTGYVWAAHVERNDCDWHLEISDENDATAPRVIAEVPNAAWNAVTWDAIAGFMRDRHKSTRSGANIKFKSAPKVVVRGRAFWDGHHSVPKGTDVQRKKGNKHGSDWVGTLWEIHPVDSFRSAQ